MKQLRRAPGGEVQLTWIGHASFLIQMDGFNILTDPHFSCRCSPFQWIGPSRYVPIPPNLLEPTSLPSVHLVVISHNHYDHLDTNSVTFLISAARMAATSGIQPHWVVPLGVRAWLLACGVAEANIHELDWWTHGSITRSTRETPPNAVPNIRGDTQLDFASVPCQHFSGRSLWDRNEALWSSWIIATPNYRV